MLWLSMMHLPPIQIAEKKIQQTDFQKEKGVSIQAGSQ